MQNEGINVPSPELQMLKMNKESGYNYRQRRHQDWLENYTLYRDKVPINRLTQRQSVNLPLMKQTIQTRLKDVDDMPVIYFENLDNDKDAEIFQNEYWKYTISPQCNNMEVKDVIDKKQEMLFGRTFDQMQIVDGKILITIEDPQDILVDRFTDPADLDTARFLIHQHIFRPLSALAENPDYDQEAVKRMQEFYATQQGILKAADNLGAMEEKNRKLAELGVPDIENPIVGETYVELSLHFLFQESNSYVNDDGETVTVEDQYMLFVECDDMEILMKKPLEVIIGKTTDNYWRNHLPYNSWAEDVERQDFWSDGVGDVVRTPNKILNVWFSQLIENRTLRSFGMHYYNNALEGFTPPNIDPEPWGWVGVPIPDGKNITDVFQKVDVPDLSESLDEMEFVIGMNDRASGATATQQGVPSARQITLGEVKLALTEAQKFNQGMSKFYTIAWQKRAEKFLKFIEAAPDKLDAVKIYKQGRNTTNIFSREIAPKDWMTKSGYRVKIWNQNERDQQQQQQFEKLTAVQNLIPGNSKLQDIVQRKALEWADVSPDDVNDILRIEQEKRDALANNPNPMGLPPGAPTPAGTPSAPVPQPPAPMMPAGQ